MWAAEAAATTTKPRLRGVTEALSGVLLADEGRLRNG